MGGESGRFGGLGSGDCVVLGGKGLGEITISIYNNIYKKE